MRNPNRTREHAIALAALAASLAHAGSTLDGYPSVTRYLKNDAPFVVFGVTPTRLDTASSSLTLTFIATEPLSQVNVFPYLRRLPDGPSRLREPVTCGPRDMGSWDCRIPLTALLHPLRDHDVELGLRIEAHGDSHARGEHSTVVVTLPVRRLPTSASK